MIEIQKAHPNTEHCDCCRLQLNRYEHFYDELHRGPDYSRAIWGWTCDFCHRNYGKGIGQIYDSVTYEKVGDIAYQRTHGA